MAGPTNGLIISPTLRSVRLIPYLFVPADVVTYIESIGDEFRFTVEIRQTNNNNRGYSNQVRMYGSLDGGSSAPVGTTADNTPDFTWKHDNTST